MRVMCKSCAGSAHVFVKTALPNAINIRLYIARIAPVPAGRVRRLAGKWRHKLATISVKPKLTLPIMLGCIVIKENEMYLYDFLFLQHENKVARIPGIIHYGQLH